MSNNLRETKQRFTLRKNKRFKNVVSVGLGLFIATAVGVSGNEAKANEIEQPKIMTTENPATNAPEAQPKSTEEAISSIEKTGEVLGTVDVNVDKSKVDEAVENARNFGLKVEKEADKNLGTAKSIEEARQKQAEVNKYYKNQETEINKKTEEYKKEDEKYKEKKKKVDDANKKLKEDYEKAKLEADQEYKKEDEKYKEEKKKIDSANKKLKEDYETAKAEAEKLAKEIADSNKDINAEKRAEYERKLAEYNRLKAEYDKLKKENNTETKGRISLLGNFNENARSSLDYYKNFTVLIEDKVELLTTPIKWNPNTEIRKIVGSNNVIRNVRLNDGEYKDFYTNLSVGDKFRLTNVAQTLAGKSVNMIFTIKGFKERPDSDSYYDKSSPYATRHIDFSKGKEDTIGVGIGVYDEIRMAIDFVDDDNLPITIAATSVLTDIDWKQGLSLNWNKSETIYKLPVESGIGKYGESYHEINGESFGDVASIPKGSMLLSGYGSSIDLTYYGNHPGKRGVFGETPDDGGYYFTMFGNSFKGRTVLNPEPEEPNYEPEKPEKPKEVKPPKYNPYPDPPKPREVKPPKYEDDPKEPEVPTVKYHYVNFDVEPNVHKEVKNVEGTNINNNLVSKLSTVNWELKTEDLPSNRERIKSYKITDYLPSGFELNLANTKYLSKGFNVVFDKSTNTAIFTADKDTLMLFNKDLTKEIKPIYPIASGTVVNDGATYENNFRLDVELVKEDTGSVVVHYVDTKGNTIKNDVVDTKEQPVGTTYTTTDNKPTEIAYNGELYIITTTIKGKEIGEVVKGNTEVTYVYDKLEPKENKGSVVVHYVDTKGDTIKNDVVDTKEQPVGTDYDTKDNQPNEITKDNVTYKITTTVKGNETGKVTNGVTEVTYVYERTTPEKPGKSYTRYSNKVVVYTPGNDPKKPRPPFPTVPGEPGENPTPHDNLIKPEKHNTSKDGMIIDGKTVAPNSINYYKKLWDFDQYKGIKATKEDVLKGFLKIDDYPEEAVEPNLEAITMVDSKGEAVEGVKVEIFESLEKATEEVKATLSSAKITPKGAFQIFTAVNPEEFFEKYIVTGNSITITNPMTLKEGFIGKFINKSWQIDFGNGYEAEPVENNVTRPEPKKHNENASGVNIDGKTLLPGSINYYKHLMDFDQYKGIYASEEAILKGFLKVDDYPEEALEPNLEAITMIDSKGEKVSGLKVEIFESLEKATEEVKTTLSSAKITPKGAFQIFTAINPKEFFEKYVVTGNSITITNPMKVKETFVGDYVNKAYQIDFGVGYEADLVVNNVPKLESKKDVVIDVTNKDKSLDGKEIELGKVRSYNLVGSKLPANRGEEITQYGFYDDYDQTGDQYDGVYLAFANVDVTLKDGTVIKKGTEITKYTTQNVDTKDGKVSIELDKAFLEKVSLDSEFQADVFLQFKRISAGTFKNTFINTVNGYETSSNTVETHTPEPPKPEEPKKPEPPKPEEPKKPEPPKPEEPKKSTPPKPEEPKKPTPPSPEKPKKVLPKTSAAKGKEHSNNAGALASGLVTLGVLTLVRKRKVK